MPTETHKSTKYFVAVFCVGVQYKFLEYMGFKNSFGDFPLGVLCKRTLSFVSWFSINYGT